jgi:hypothetical protein
VYRPSAQLCTPQKRSRGPVVDYETQAIRRADRPGLEGGANFWDLWRLEWERRGGELVDPVMRDAW